MNIGILYAAITALCLAGFLVLNKKSGADPFIGAAIARFSGLIVALAIISFMALRGGGAALSFSGWTWVALAGGIIAIGDIFMFLAFRSGVPLYIIGPIISGGSVLLVALMGVIFLGESVTLIKGLGILTVAIGVVLLSL